MPKKKYKIKVDISTALKELEKLGLAESKSVFWISTSSEDPDDACAEVRDKVYDMVAAQCKRKKNKRYKEAAEIVKDKMKIVKIVKV